MGRNGKKTAKELILERLGGSQSPLALHELGIFGHSPISLQRRLYELKAEGIVVSKMREDKNFLEWSLIPLIPVKLAPTQRTFPKVGDDQTVVARVGHGDELDLKAERCGSCGSRFCSCRAERAMEREDKLHHDRY